MAFDYDYVIIGSGFGGSVSAYRLAEKGYSVCVVERGKRFRDQDFAKSNWDLRRYLWMPLFRCFGIQNLSLFKNVLILSGAGVGGGSLVYANTLLEPGDGFYTASVWKNLAHWREELAPHYITAKKMLGVTKNPLTTAADKILLECAKDLGREKTFHSTEVGVYFGEAGKTHPDPYFGGQGPERQGCIHCGGCMVGCRHNSKNTLVKNYLYFAEKLGVKILPEKTVVDIVPLPSGYQVKMVSSTAWIKTKTETVTAKNVVLSAGVLGTVSLLLKCKYVTRSLEKISETLGHYVRTNSEALVGVTEVGAQKKNDYSQGVAITSIFHPDDHTHIEPVHYSDGSSFMRVLAAPMVDGGGRIPRPIKFFLSLGRHPVNFIRALFTTRWARSSIILLVMQTVDNKMKFTLGRNLFTLYRKRMTTAPEAGEYKIPSYIPIANQVGRMFAEKVKGIPQSAINESLLDIPTTAHILGGCVIGSDPTHGVISERHEVFSYPGLYVCDGSVIPANLGVNPSLTITAMTERAISKIPAKIKT